MSDKCKSGWFGVGCGVALWSEFRVDRVVAGEGCGSVSGSEVGGVCGSNASGVGGVSGATKHFRAVGVSLVNFGVDSRRVSGSVVVSFAVSVVSTSTSISVRDSGRTTGIRGNEGSSRSLRRWNSFVLSSWLIGT